MSTEGTYQPRMTLDLPLSTDAGGEVAEAAGVDGGGKEEYSGHSSTPGHVQGAASRAVARALGPEASTEIGQVRAVGCDGVRVEVEIWLAVE